MMSIFEVLIVLGVAMMSAGAALHVSERIRSSR